MNKSELKSLSEETIKDEFNKLNNLDYNWFTIVFEDGTGILFNNTIPQYGTIDSEGCIVNTIEYIKLY